MIRKRFEWIVAFGLALFVMVVAWNCSQDGGSSREVSTTAGDQSAATKQAIQKQPNKTQVGGKVLLVAQSTFSRSEKGHYTQPNAARLFIFRQEGSGWQREEISDNESNVFHKGMVIEDSSSTPASPAIVTIAGNKAALKIWHRGSSGWEAKTLWQPTFGGEHNRLRDMEVGDVTGDGQDEIVLATHDQGVVAVVSRTKSGWNPEEIDRSANTFVHEIELGDVDGDGRADIFATPSQPNRGRGGPQPGKVTRYHWTGEGFESEVVAEWANRHAKEILVTDLDGDNRPELYVALEGETEQVEGTIGGRLVHPVEIVRVSPSQGEGGWTKEVVATIPEERLCRFLVAGDLDGDGSSELIAASFSKGIWMFEPGASLPFQGRSITTATGGFEHASLLADIDGDNALELYVADDSHGRLVRFTWNDGNLSAPEVIRTRTVPQSAMTWNLWVAELPAN